MKDLAIECIPGLHAVHVTEKASRSSKYAPVDLLPLLWNLSGNTGYVVKD